MCLFLMVLLITDVHSLIEAYNIIKGNKFGGSCDILSLTRVQLEKYPVAIRL